MCIVHRCSMYNVKFKCTVLIVPIPRLIYIWLFDINGQWLINKYNYLQILKMQCYVHKIQPMPHVKLGMIDTNNNNQYQNLIIDEFNG